MDISEKEFAIIREIASNNNPDQRTIAANTGISLGLTNLIIKRLINKGYIKAKQLNRKKIQYMLTLKGFSEKAKKSYEFTRKTVGVLRLFRERIQDLVELERQKGAREFVLTGNSDILDIAELSIRNLNDSKIRYSRIHLTQSADLQATVTVVYEGDVSRSVDIIGYIADSGIAYW